MRICPRCRAVYSAQIERCPSDGERVLEDQRHPLIGQTLDRYRIVEALGEGAMGCVYRAVHNVLPREYALKVLYKDLAANQTLIERFRREAQAASAMEHPNIVSVVDFVNLPNGVAFIVMELVSGRTLEQAITAEAPFSPGRAANIVKQVAAGLGEAHRRGFVHRDVKPSNIMLSETPAGELVKVLDFGVVGLEAGAPDTRLTAVGHIIGTPTYMAPEQVHDPGVGPAADFYALGVILFEMLAGEPPFTGVDRTQVFVKHISEPPPRLPPCGGLEHIAYWLLEKRAGKRPRNADELIQAIERLALDGPAPARAPSESPSDKETTLRPVRSSTARPAVRRGSTGPMSLEADTFRPDGGLIAAEIARAVAERDTDEELEKKELERAMEVTSPRIESARPFVATKARPTSAHVGSARFGGSAVADVATSLAPADEPFATLPTGASGADWPAWDPDGAFTAQRIPADGADTQPSVLSESSRSIPRVVEPAAVDDAAKKTGQRARATQVVRQRGRDETEPLEPALVDDARETVRGVAQDPPLMIDARVEELDLYAEPELPRVPTDDTARNRVDDGPTQVDFDVSLLPGIDDPPLAIPVTDEVPNAAPETKITDPELAQLGTSGVPEDAFERLDASTAVDLEPPPLAALDVRPLEQAGLRDTEHDPVDPLLDTPTLGKGEGAHASAALKALDLPQVGPEFFRALEGLDGGQGPTLQDFDPVPSRTEKVPPPSATIPSAMLGKTVSSERALVRDATRARWRAVIIGLILGLVLAGAALAVAQILRPRSAPTANGVPARP